MCGLGRIPAKQLQSVVVGQLRVAHAVVGACRLPVMLGVFRGPIEEPLIEVIVDTGGLVGSNSAMGRSFNASGSSARSTPLAVVNVMSTSTTRKLTAGRCPEETEHRPPVAYRSPFGFRRTPNHPPIGKLIKRFARLPTE